MAGLLLLGILGLAVLFRPAAAAGTVLALYNEINGPILENVPPHWVAPDPTVNRGCTDLGPNFIPVSGRFTPGAKTGTWECKYVVFFFTANCQARGGEPALRMPDDGSAAQYNNFYGINYSARVPKARSVGCSFAVNPCAASPCEDENAWCFVSTYNITDPTTNEKFKAWNTRDCSTCRKGFHMVNGKCKDVCSNMQCPTGATCDYAPGSGAFCKCPLGEEVDAITNTCRRKASS